MAISSQERGRQGPSGGENGAEPQARDSRTVDRVYRQLRAAIVSGELPANEEISQVKMARDLGISRTPLREVLRMLQSEGLLIAKPTGRLQIAGTSLDELEQIYAMRLPIEALAVRFTVPRLTSSEIARLEGSMAEMAHFASVDEWELYEEQHREFHGLLTSKAGSRTQLTIADLHDHSRRYRMRYALSTPAHMWPQEHRAILDAAKARDADLTASMLMQHLARTPLSLIAEVDPSYEPGILIESLRMHGISLPLKAV